MAEGARLESVYTATYRGFESLSLRHIQKNRLYGGFFMPAVACALGARTCSPPRILQRRAEKTETKGRAMTANTHPFYS